ncbi:cytochrome c oxidase subunit II [Thermoflexales bacterium]|nr:cytochrome c oxidase subunit II [Thermoflexales bacterium]
MDLIRTRLSLPLLFIGLSALAIVMAPNPIALAAPAARHFRIEASSFQYTPAAIHVNPGDQVTIDLVATDVVHGLYIDGYDLNLTADPGQTASLSFSADRSGSFRFRCSVTCGALHPFMIGKLNVGANDLLWRAIGLGLLAISASVWIRPHSGRAPTPGCAPRTSVDDVA